MDIERILSEAMRIEDVARASTLDRCVSDTGSPRPRIMPRCRRSAFMTRCLIVMWPVRMIASPELIAGNIIRVRPPRTVVDRPISMINEVPAVNRRAVMNQSACK